MRPAERLMVDALRGALEDSSVTHVEQVVADRFGVVKDRIRELRFCHGGELPPNYVEVSNPEDAQFVSEDGGRTLIPKRAYYEGRIVD